MDHPSARANPREGERRAVTILLRALFILALLGLGWLLKTPLTLIGLFWLDTIYVLKKKKATSLISANPNEPPLTRFERMAEPVMMNLRYAIVGLRRADQHQRSNIPERLRELWRTIEIMRSLVNEISPERNEIKVKWGLIVIDATVIALDYGGKDGFGSTEHDRVKLVADIEANINRVNELLSMPVSYKP